jgi:hypothetical protein
MGEVRYFHDETILTDKGVNDDCVGYLEGLLDKARNGEVVGVAVAIQFADGSTASTASGFIFNQRVVGALMTQVVKLSQ